MSEQYLFEPTLKPGVNYELQTYSHNAMVFMSFIGGLPTALIVGFLNARSLRLEKSVIYSFTCFGIVLMGLKFYMQSIAADASTLLLICIAELVIFVISYLRSMRKKMLFVYWIGTAPKSAWRIGLFSVPAGWIIDVVLAAIARGIHG